jgi:hypothetical protein
MLALTVSPNLQEFSNGYALGRLFHNLNLQPDFDKFTQKSTPDANINNFTRLQVGDG